MKSSEIVGAVRLLKPEDVRALGADLGLEPADRLELLYQCLTSKTARKRLRHMLYGKEQRTPPRGAPAPLVQQPPPPPRAPVEPRCKLRLNFDNAGAAPRGSFE